MLYCHQVAIKSINAALNIHGFLLCFLSVIRGRFNPQMSEKEAAAFIIKVIQSCFLSSRWDKYGDTLTRCKHDNLLCYVVVVYVQGSHAHIYINLSSTGAKRTTCCSITRTKSLTEEPPPAGPPLYVQHKRLYTSNANSRPDDSSEAVDVEPLWSCERDNNNMALWSCTSECLN